MTMITRFTKEQLIAKAQEQIEFIRRTQVTGAGREHVDICVGLFEIALASLEAGKSPETPGGYVMVPESVTPAMAVAGGDVFVKSEQVSEYPTDAARNIYRAMLAAVPQEVKGE